MSGFKCKCSACGWTTRRAPKNITRPCPKCGGAVKLHEDDKENYAVFIVLFLIGAGVIALLSYAANGHL